MRHEDAAYCRSRAALPSLAGIVSCVVIRRWLPIPCLVLLVGVGAPPPARANNAFPDTGQVLLPPDRPDTIVVGTNFGLVITEDGGASWRWTCEHDEGVGGIVYELAPGPRHRVLTLADGMAFTDDLACTWQTPDPPDPFIYDVFPDPSTIDRYLLAVDRVAGGTNTNVIVESTDAGHSLGKVLFTAPAGMEVGTLEVARSDPRVIYATMYKLDGQGPNQVARTTDGGQSWTVVTPVSTIGKHDLWIAAVDPENPRKMFLRVLTGDGLEKLALTEDGGDTMTTPLESDGLLTSFVRLPDGTVLVGALSVADGRIYRSTDGGHSFTSLPTTIHPRGLAQRAGKLYAATDNVADGFALAVSDDTGTSWRRVMSFSDIGSISTCGSLPGACVNSCAGLMRAGLIRPTLCAATTPDAGAAGGGGGRGCSCRVGGREAHRASSGLGGEALFIIALGLLWSRRARR
jgi:hypothetical protein